MYYFNRKIDSINYCLSSKILTTFIFCHLILTLNWKTQISLQKMPKVRYRILKCRSLRRNCSLILQLKSLPSLQSRQESYWLYPELHYFDRISLPEKWQESQSTTWKRHDCFLKNQPFQSFWTWCKALKNILEVDDHPRKISSDSFC